MNRKSSWVKLAVLGLVVGGTLPAYADDHHSASERGSHYSGGRYAGSRSERFHLDGDGYFGSRSGGRRQDPYYDRDRSYGGRGYCWRSEADHRQEDRDRERRHRYEDRYGYGNESRHRYEDREAERRHRYQDGRSRGNYW